MHKDERGVAHLLLILLLVVVISVAGYAGWRVVNNKAPSAKASQATASSHLAAAITPDATCMQQYKDTDLCKFAAHTDMATTAFTATLVTSAGSQSLTTTIKTDGKGNFASTSSPSGLIPDAVLLNHAAYLKGADGTWLKYSDTSTVSSRFDSLDTYRQKLGSAATHFTIKNLGKAQCGKLDCVKYQVVDPASSSTTTYIWIDTQHYLLQRVEGTEAVGKYTATVSYDPVTITAPSPAKDASANASDSLKAFQSLTGLSQ